VLARRAEHVGEEDDGPEEAVDERPEEEAGDDERPEEAGDEEEAGEEDEKAGGTCPGGAFLMDECPHLSRVQRFDFLIAGFSDLYAEASARGLGADAALDWLKVRDNMLRLRDQLAIADARPIASDRPDHH